MNEFPMESKRSTVARLQIKTRHRWESGRLRVGSGQDFDIAEWPVRDHGLKLERVPGRQKRESGCLDGEGPSPLTYTDFYIYCEFTVAPVYEKYRIPNIP